VREHWQQSVKEIQQAVIADLQSYLEEASVIDDITLVIGKRL
jgi:serine phosphatase RsbU (regulator of sigma subunit)